MVSHSALTFSLQSNCLFISGLFGCQLDGVSGAQLFSHRNALADEMKLIFKHADSVPFRICENLVQPVADLTRTKLLTVSQVRDAFHWMVSRSQPQAVPAFRFEPNPCLFMNFDFRLAHITSSCFCGLQTWKSLLTSVFLLITFSLPFLCSILLALFL